MSGAHVVAVKAGQVLRIEHLQEDGDCPAREYIQMAAPAKRDGVHSVYYTQMGGAYMASWIYESELPADLPALQEPNNPADEEKDKGNNEQPLDAGQEQAEPAE